jgi:hypothetical protein
MEAFQLRLWDGRLGRWLSPDPYGQHSSPYLGMGNSPVNTIDPDGGWETRFGAWWHGLWDGRDGTVFKSKTMGDYGISYQEGFDPGDGSIGIRTTITFGGERYNDGDYNSIPAPRNSTGAGVPANTIPCIKCHNEFPSYAGFDTPDGIELTIGGDISNPFKPGVSFAGSINITGSSNGLFIYPQGGYQIGNAPGGVFLGINALYSNNGKPILGKQLLGSAHTGTVSLPLEGFNVAGSFMDGGSYKGYGISVTPLETPNVSANSTYTPFVVDVFRLKFIK